jgi:hypothetical protein
MNQTAMPASDILSLLASLMDFLDPQADGEVGPDGKIKGNDAMSLMAACEDAYLTIERSGVANDI